MPVANSGIGGPEAAMALAFASCHIYDHTSSYKVIMVSNCLLR